ncbi:hypothetical protein LSAT2_016401 [Lamellibrachia satsuma]|nr:hypothetical protein LSAT2_016401 [Lamellibrachia satsuma]
MEKFLGKWEVTGTENMDNMLKAFDMEAEKRALYANMQFTMEYKRDGDKWSYTVCMGKGMDKTFNFVPGEEFDSTTLDGRPIISKISIEGDKFVEHHKDKEDPTLDAVMIREVNGDKLIVKATVRNVTSITRHKRS